MTSEELGAFTRLAWALACKGVNTYSQAEPSPWLPDDDGVLAGMAWCTKRRWQKLKPGVMSEFRLSDGKWRLASDEIIRISRRPSRNPIPAAVKSAASARDGQRCAYCGGEDGPFHFDHIFPVARGGTDEAHNIVIACRSCNLSKGDKTVVEWVSFLRSRE